MASAAQCERIVNEYVDLQLSEDRGARSMTSEDRSALRGRLAAEARRDPTVRRVATHCETDVTEDAFRCAVAARTTKAWSLCMR